MNNKRDHFRVDILAALEWEVLKPEEKAMIRSGGSHEYFGHSDLPSPIDEFLEQVSPGSQEEQLYRTFQYLNNKLDFLIDQLLAKSTGYAPHKDNVVELSASGLKFTTNECPAVGTHLKMNLILPGTFQYQLFFIAEVVRVDTNETMNLIAVKIITIDEDVRDSIIKVVFQKQRRDIRLTRDEQLDE